MRFYLIGPMGAGKTTVGKRLAEQIGSVFLDTDEMIVHQQQKSISDIFQNHGELFFRDQESQVLQKTAEYDDAIIATGGGIVLRAVNRKFLKASGRVIYLKISLEAQLRRLAQDTARPLLKSANLDELNKIREPYYREICDSVVDVDVSVERVVQKIRFITDKQQREDKRK